MIRGGAKFGRLPLFACSGFAWKEQNRVAFGIVSLQILKKIICCLWEETRASFNYEAVAFSSCFHCVFIFGLRTDELFLMVFGLSSKCIPPIHLFVAIYIYVGLLITKKEWKVKPWLKHQVVDLANEQAQALVNTVA